MEKADNPTPAIEITSTETNISGTDIRPFYIADIRHDDLEYKREIIVHNGSVVIVPVFDDGTVAMVRQYRYAAGKFLLEIPAGTLNKDEPMEDGRAAGAGGRDRGYRGETGEDNRILCLTRIFDRENVCLSRDRPDGHGPEPRRRRDTLGRKISLFRNYSRRSGPVRSKTPRRSAVCF